MLFILSIVLLYISLLLSQTVHSRPSESERVALWHAAGNTWPPQWQEESPKYAKAMADREVELQQLTGSRERWENWMQYTAGRLVPRFTPMGFEIIQTPKHVNDKLMKRINEALEDFDAVPAEDDIGAIYSKFGQNPKFINMNGLDREVLSDLREYHEEWANGMELVGTSAYGTRMYLNGSSLVMHYDKIHSHVISSIVHLAHEYDDDDEPWPIQIEDHDGVLHSVNLEVGQMLFYESAKCLHGRLQEFKGKYYGSIFLHYQPVDKSIWNYTIDDVIARVPPHWNEGCTEEVGSRWAGQAITVDSMTAMGSPSRVVNGKYIHDNISPHAVSIKKTKVAVGDDGSEL